MMEVAIYIRTYLYTYMCIHAYTQLWVASGFDGTIVYVFHEMDMHGEVLVATYIRTYLLTYMHKCIHAYTHTCIHTVMGGFWI